MAVGPGTALPYPPQPGRKPRVTPGDDTGAVTITAAQLAEVIGGDTDRAERLLEVAAQTVIDYAPTAPTSLLNEAVIRFAGYLAEAAPPVITDGSLGPASTTYVVNHGDALRRCGAKALLSRYKRRRARST